MRDEPEYRLPRGVTYDAEADLVRVDPAMWPRDPWHKRLWRRFLLWRWSRATGWFRGPYA